MPIDRPDPQLDAAAFEEWLDWIEASMAAIPRWDTSKRLVQILTSDGAPDPSCACRWFRDRGEDVCVCTHSGDDHENLRRCWTVLPRV